MLLIIALIGALLIYWFQGILYHRFWNRNLNVQISFKNTDCIEGEENILIEEITNRKTLPLPLLHVKFNTPKSFLFKNEDNSSVTDYYYRDDTFSIMGHESITRSLIFNCSKRGCFYMNDTSLVTNDLFLQKTFNMKISNQNVIHVYPKKIDVSAFEIPFKTITGSFATQKTLVEDPFEFRGIREYQPYDSIHNINWKSSARTDKLQVNNFFMTSSQAVAILLNLDTHLYTKKEILIESGIRIASSLAERFICAGIPVSLESNGIDSFTNERIFQSAGQGQSHMLALDNALSRINTNADNTDFLTLLKNVFQNTDNYTYYIIISNNHSSDLVSYYNSIKEIGINCYYVIPEQQCVDINENIPDMIKWNID